MTGRLITFEGIDGSGKTTQIDLLEEQLIRNNIPYLILREPGGTKLSEKIRNILLDRKNIHLSPESESLLFVSARAQLMQEKIQPALEKRKFVICDRFADSTVAYQGFGKGLNVQYLEELNNFSTNNIFPDLTIILDIEPREAAKRIQHVELDRMESMGLDFFQRVQEGYYEIANKNSNRCVIINGSQPSEEVFKLVYKKIKEKFLEEIICT